MPSPNSLITCRQAPHGEKSSALAAMERQWAQEQQISERSDGSIELRIKTSGWYDVKKWVLSFGAEARVLEPQHLQDKVKNEIVKMVKRYQGLSQ